MVSAGTDFKHDSIDFDENCAVSSKEKKKKRGGAGLSAQKKRAN